MTFITFNFINLVLIHYVIIYWGYSLMTSIEGLSKEFFKDFVQNLIFYLDILVPILGYATAVFDEGANSFGILEMVCKTSLVDIIND